MSDGVETGPRETALGLDGLPVDPALIAEAAALDADAAPVRHAELAAAIERANKAYYEADAPELTDGEYDELFRSARCARGGVSRPRDAVVADAAGRCPPRRDVR